MFFLLKVDVVGFFNVKGQFVGFEPIRNFNKFCIEDMCKCIEVWMRVEDVCVIGK